MEACLWRGQLTKLSPTYVKMEPGDYLIQCSSCGVVFLFGGGELEYFESNELEHPRRCGPCRKARKSGRQHVTESIPEKERDRELDNHEL